MITKNYRVFIHFRDYFHPLRGSLSLTSNSTCLRHRNFGCLSMLFTSKSDVDDMLILSNPLTLIPARNLRESSLLPSLEDSNHSSLIDLSLRPLLKIDKKVKKNDKDEDREVEKLKLKVKKKVRSKVSFEEDYDSVNELFESSEISLASELLPLARPTKPTVLGPISPSNTKQKSAITYKKKGSASVQKKTSTLALEIQKPEKVSLKVPLTVQGLSDLFKVPTTEIIKSLFLKGIPVTVNQLLDLSVSQKLAEEFDIIIENDTELTSSDSKHDNNKIIKGSEIRAPIVTIMGHVDHGKTTLLDKIRKTQVAQKEAGGITQRIGAYEVTINSIKDTRRIIFLDTPGHEAFSGMRSRGVSITDIVILVVAADDGVKPQTIEAIKCAQFYNVPIIVAINKIDKENANIEGIKRELSQFGLIAEDWGGDTLMVPISAIQETNIDSLLEMIILLSEVLNLKADSHVSAESTILESHLDRSKGPVASILIQNGTLRVGDNVVFSTNLGKVRGMMNSRSENIKEAGPSSPVIIWGLPTVPLVGEKLFSFKDEREAKTFVTSVKTSTQSNTPILQSFADSQLISSLEVRKKLNLIIKTDSQGSIEAINSILSKIDTLDIELRVLYSSTGEVTETDIEFASTSNAIILAFNTTAASGAKKLAKGSSVSIKEFDVVYDLFDYVQTVIDDIVGPQYDEKFIGKAAVKTVFPLAKSFVAGSLILEGKVTSDSLIEVVRANQVLYKGPITSLKRLKETVSEVSSGLECGIFIDTFDVWKPEDIISVFERVPKKKNTL